jgi:arginyl-tRNA synthetase
MIHGEGYYYFEDKMPAVIAEGIKMGVMVKGEKGALIIPMNDPKADAKQAVPPCIIRKSDGATTYATRDLARIKDWRETYHADMGVVLCDIAQKLHHDQVNEAADKLGWNTKESIRVHFGRMSFPEGGMSTRKGKVVLLEDVLDEAEKRAYEKIEQHKSELPEPEKRELARKMGIGAIKYNILSQNRFKNYTFDWNQMLSFEGNSAPYLQYAYTRTQSVLRKEEGKSSSLKPLGASPLFLSQLKEEEKSLIKKLLNYEETIKQSLSQFKPNLLCTYLFELAQSFSHFYNNLRVLEAETQEKKTLRLALVIGTGAVLKHGLNLLGIEVPERM